MADLDGIAQAMCDQFYDVYSDEELGYMRDALVAAGVGGLLSEIDRHHADFERWEEMAAAGAGRSDEVGILRTALTGLLDAQFKADRVLDLARGRARAALIGET